MSYVGSLGQSDAPVTTNGIALYPSLRTWPFVPNTDSGLYGDTLAVNLYGA